MDLRDLVKLAGIVNPELLGKMQPSTPDCGCGGVEEEADGAGFEEVTTRPDPEVMDDPMATYGSDVDLSLRRYLKSKGDHVTVDEDVYPDLTVEDISEAYGSYKKKKTNEGRMSDQIIGDSETMTKAEFAKKYGKEMADEYYESTKVVEASCGCCGNDPCDCSADCSCKTNESTEDKKKADESVDYLKKLAGL